MNIFTNQRKSTINPMEKYNNRFLYSTNTKDKITIFGKKYELLICFQSIDIIVKHMWPLTVTLPKYRESYIVTLADKYCATSEMLKFIKIIILIPWLH